MNPTQTTDFVAPPLHEDVKNGKRVDPTSTQDDLSEDHARARPVNRFVVRASHNSRAPRDLLADALCLFRIGQRYRPSSAAPSR